MHIVEMTAENIKRIKAIKIKPEGNMVVIEGKNAAGKTSALDCIAYALGGKKFIPDNPIRDGQEKAFVEMVIGDYKISRTWTAKGTYLKLENKDGFKSSNPQKMLDAAIGDLSFDPMKFCNYSKSERLEVLRNICGLSFADLEKTYKENFEERTYLNRQLKEVDAQVKPYEDLPEVNESLRTIQAVEEERKEITEDNARVDRALESIKRKKDAISDNLRNIKRREQDILAIKSDTEKLKMEIENYSKVAAYPQKDFKHLVEEIDCISKNNALLEQHKMHTDLSHKQCDLIDKINICETLIGDAKFDKENRIKAAKMPIEGLGLTKSDVAFDGIEFSEISSAQKIKVSMSMAIALNPKIKIIRILNGSLLDNEAMKEIETIAKDKGFQVWIERVSDNKSEDCIYIEEGEIK